MVSLLFRTVVTVALVGVLVGQTFAAGFSYRYRDNAGATHIGYSVPPDFVGNGYEVLNDRGRVVNVVLPKTILNERSAQLLQEAEARHKHEMQIIQDQTLLRYYSSAADVKRVRDRKLQEFKDFVQITRANIKTNRKRVIELQREAAQLQRTGHKVPVAILESLQTLEGKINKAVQAIEHKELEKERLWTAFEADIARLNYLLGNKDKAQQSTNDDAAMEP